MPLGDAVQPVAVVAANGINARNGRASASLESRRATGECCLSDDMISGPDAFKGVARRLAINARPGPRGGRWHRPVDPHFPQNLWAANPLQSEFFCGSRPTQLPL